MKYAYLFPFVLVLLLLPSVVGISFGLDSYHYYVFGDDTVTPFLVFNQSGNDSMLTVDDDGLFVQNHANNWFRITGNVTGGSIPGYLTSAYHPHNQSVNATDIISFRNFLAQANSVIINEDSNDVDFRVESNGNINMLMVDGGDNCVGIGIDPLAQNQLCVYDSSNHIYIRVETDKTDGQVSLILMNDAMAWRLLCETNDNFRIYDPVNAKVPFQIEKNPSSNLMYLKGDCVGFMDATPTTTIDVTGDISYTGTITDDSDYRIKRIIGELPKNAVKKWCENQTIYRYLLYDYWDNTDSNYTLGFTIGDLTDQQDIGFIAQEVYNITKELFNEKLANVIVRKGNDTQLWEINEIMCLKVFARYSQILYDDIEDLKYRIWLLEQEVFG